MGRTKWFSAAKDGSLSAGLFCPPEPCTNVSPAQTSGQRPGPKIPGISAVTTAKLKCVSSVPLPGAVSTLLHRMFELTTSAPVLLQVAQPGLRDFRRSLGSAQQARGATLESRSTAFGLNQKTEGVGDWEGNASGSPAPSLSDLVPSPRLPGSCILSRCAPRPSALSLRPGQPRLSTLKGTREPEERELSPRCLRWKWGDPPGSPGAGFLSRLSLPLGP